MREIVEQLRIHLWAVVHHRWIALIGAILICIAGWVAVAMMPPQYEVDTRFYMDTQSVLKPLLNGLTVNNPVRAQAADIMLRTLTARPYLEEVARQTDLDINARTPEQKEAILDSLAAGLNIQKAQVGPRHGRNNIYQLSFTNPDPKKAKQIVEAFLNIFVEHVLKAGRQDSAEAGQFLDDQIKDYATKLDAADNALKKFKEEHVGMMPQQGHTYFQRMYDLQNQLADAQLSLNMARDRAAELKQQLAAASAGASTQGAISTPLDQRIQKLEDRLTQLKLKYTDKYPDVVQTEAVLKQLREQQKEEQAQAAKHPNQASSGLAQSKAYQDLQVMIGKAQGNVAALTARVQEYQRRIADLRSKVNVIPQVEAEYSKLMRNFGIIKSTYQQLVQRKQSAELSNEAAQSTDESQFRIVDPPVVPAKPQKPNRLILLTMVMLAGIAGGVGLAWLYAQIKPPIYTRNQLERITSYPVLGSVSMIWTPAERAARRVGIFGLGSAFTCLILVYGGLMVHYGLDLGPITDSVRSFEGHLRTLGGKLL